MLPHERLCIGGLGDGKRIEPRRDDGGPIVIAPEYCLRVLPDAPVITSRYRRQVVSLGDYSVDVWVDETISNGEALLKLLDGYSVPHG